MKRLLFVALVALMTFTSGSLVQTILADTPTPTPTPSYKITRDEAIVIASQYLPDDIANTAGRIISSSSQETNQKPDFGRVNFPIDYWVVAFDDTKIVNKEQLGWQADNRTTLEDNDLYNVFFIYIDAMTGELLFREAYYDSGIPIPGVIVQMINSPSSLRPGFSWTDVTNATEYEFILATDSALTNVVVKDNLSETSYQLNFDLQPNFTYFWAVMVTKPAPGIPSIGVFTTVASIGGPITPPPAPSRTVPLPTTPATEPPPTASGTNWWLIWGSISGVVIVGVLVSILIWRKRQSHKLY
jgi:hypothetical protein